MVFISSFKLEMWGWTASQQLVWQSYLQANTSRSQGTCQGWWHVPLPSTPHSLLLVTGPFPRQDLTIHRWIFLLQPTGSCDTATPAAYPVYHCISAMRRKAILLNNEDIDIRESTYSTTQHLDMTQTKRYFPTMIWGQSLFLPKPVSK